MKPTKITVTYGEKISHNYNSKNVEFTMEIQIDDPSQLNQAKEKAMATMKAWVSKEKGGV